MGIFSELRRRHVFRVAGAYLLLAWVVLQVTDTLISVLELPGGIGRVVFYILVVGFPLAIFASWVFEITPEGIKRDSDTDHLPVRSTSTGRAVDFVIIAALTVVVGFLAWDRIAPEDGYRSVAVLPVRSIDGDDTSILFANGMHDTLLAELATAANLDVIARRSVAEFANSDMSIAEIAAKLGVTHIIEASVQKFGDQLRVSAQLIDAKSDTHLWADTYDEEIGFDNFFDVQSALVTRISTSLETVLFPIVEIGSRNEEAVQDYLAAISILYNLDRPGTHATPLLESAVAKDPGFALAWVRLADQYQQAYWWRGRDPEVRDRAESALRQARALQPDLPELHLVTAKVLYHGYLDLEGALEELDLAEQAMPGSAEVFEWRGNVYRFMGDAPAALLAYERAMELDPNSEGIYFEYGMTLKTRRRFREAEIFYEQALERFPDSRFLLLQSLQVDFHRYGDASGIVAALKGSELLELPDGMTWMIDNAWTDGQFDLALEYMAKREKIDFRPYDKFLGIQKAFILRDAGRGEEARAIFEQEAVKLDELLAADPDDFDLLNVAAMVAMALGEEERAIEHARRAVNIARNAAESGADQPAPRVDAMALAYGETLCQLGDFDGAADAFRVVLGSKDPLTLKSLVANWPPCRDKFVGTPQYEALEREFGHLTEG
jgi:TolB-like protein/Tfp pilus assembly protein PilF